MPSPLCLSPFHTLRQLAAEIYAPPSAATVDEWADLHRVIIERAGVEPGRYSTDTTPFARRVMRAFTDPRYREVCISAASQVFKTESLMNLVMYTIDARPRPVLFVLPTEKVCQQFFDHRLVPTLMSCPRIARRLVAANTGGSGGGVKGIKVGAKKNLDSNMHLHFDRMDIWVMPSNSPSNIRSKSIGLAIMDEVQTCNPQAYYEIVQRTKAVHDAMIVAAGVPSFEGDGIDPFIKTGTDERYHVPCPVCGTFQQLHLRHIRWPGGLGETLTAADFKRHLTSVQSKAHYECVNCKQPLTDRDKPALLARGVWLEPHQTLPKAPPLRPGTPRELWRHGCIPAEPGIPNIRCSVTIGGLYAPWSSNSWGVIAREYVDARGQPPRTWWNGVIGKAWSLPGSGQGHKFEEVKALRVAEDRPGGYKLGTVPVSLRPHVATAAANAGSCEFVLIGMFDIQGDRAYYTVNAFTLDLVESALVACGALPAPEGGGLRALDKIVAGTWPMQRDLKKRVRSLIWLCDTGYRTNEVYAAVLRWQYELAPSLGLRSFRAYASKGSSGELDIVVKATRRGQDSTGRPLAQQFHFAEIDTIKAKDSLAVRIGNALKKTSAVDDDDPLAGQRVGVGAEHHADIAADAAQAAARIRRLPVDIHDNYLRHITNEEAVTMPRKPGMPAVRFWRPVGGNDSLRRDWLDCDAGCEAMAEFRFLGSGPGSGPGGEPGGLGGDSASPPSPFAGRSQNPRPRTQIVSKYMQDNRLR